MSSNSFFIIISYGQKVMAMLNAAGDWLMQTPGDFQFNWSEFGVSLTIPNPFGSVAEMILGTGIATILVIKILALILKAIPVA